MQGIAWIACLRTNARSEAKGRSGFSQAGVFISPYKCTYFHVERNGKMGDVDIGYVRLIIAVIKQAIGDAKRELKKGRVEGSYSASMFINSQEFIEMCHLINCDGEMIRNKVFEDLGI